MAGAEPRSGLLFPLPPYCTLLHSLYKTLHTFLCTISLLESRTVFVKETPCSELRNFLVSLYLHPSYVLGSAVLTGRAPQPLATDL